MYKAFSTFLCLLFIFTKGNSEVTDDQLLKFSEDLLNLDQNVASPVYDIQGKLKSRPKPEDFATKPLFQPLPTEILNRPTYAKFIKLLDNYDRKVEMPEDVTAQEQKEMDDFLITLLNTPVMKKSHEFLIQSGKLNKNDNFTSLMHDLWFKIYPRWRKILGSSGFEHVFVGEIKNNAISGLHNWIQYYILEKNKQVKYQGFNSILTLKKPVVLLKYKFAWDQFTKPTSTMFIGTSPEFEIGLYTVCFYLKPNAKCPISLGGKTISIQTHTERYKGNTYIGSAYPKFN